MSLPQLKSLFGPNYKACITVCCTKDSFEATDEMIASNPDIYAAYGIHPHDANTYSEEIEQQIIQRMSDRKVVAWGECGLDYYKNLCDRNVQLEVFRKQLIQAVNLNKPIVIHTRDAESDTFQLMKEYLPKKHKIHVHCFTQSKKFAFQLLEHFENLFIGVTGIITFKQKSVDPLRETIKEIPLEKLLLETDGPWLSPHPYRSDVAHPGMIPITGKKIAELKEIDEEIVFDQILKNTNIMYGI